MTKLNVLGNALSICIAPHTKNGMYMRQRVTTNTQKQREVKIFFTELAIQNRGKSPAEVRSAIASAMAGKNFGGPSKSERASLRHATADANLVKQKAMLRA